MSQAQPMRMVFGRTLCELGEEFPELVVLDADVSTSTQTKLFGAKYPDRFYNFGVAEANMVSAAAGMAASGLVPVASSFAFLLALRAGDPVRSLIAYNSLNVKLAGGYAGLSDYADGASHQSVTDLAVMTSLPNLTVICPSDISQTRWATRAMIEHKGPVFLRLAREEVGQVHDAGHPFRIGTGVVMRDGADVTLIASGMMLCIAIQAADDLRAKGIDARLIDMHTIKPLDVDLVLAAARETGAIVTVEEHSIIGGLGSMVCGAVCRHSPAPVLRCGLPDRFGESGAYAEILSRAGLSAAHVVELAEQALAMKPGR